MSFSGVALTSAASSPTLGIPLAHDYERGLITERVNAGIVAAKANGTRFGRPPWWIRRL